VKTLELDYIDGESINIVAREFADVPLDVLINCAGSSQLCSLVTIEVLAFGFTFLTSNQHSAIRGTTSDSQNYQSTIYLAISRSTLS
jgi:hypothetical protein